MPLTENISSKGLRTMRPIMKSLFLIFCLILLPFVGEAGESKEGSRIVWITEDQKDKDKVMYEFPAVSADGKYLTYQYSEDPREVTLPSGKKVTDFTDDSNWDIYRMRLDGSEPLLRLTNAPTQEDQALFSPDGKTIAYRFWNKGSHDLWLMDADGKNKRPLVEDPQHQEKTPTFSPDGKKVVFFSNRDGVKWNLYMIDLKTRKIQRLTRDHVSDKHPQFTPDGAELIFHSNRAGVRYFDKELGEENTYDIYSLHLTTGKITRLTFHSQARNSKNIGDARHPFISPDGRFITYHVKTYQQDDKNPTQYFRAKRSIHIISRDGKRGVNVTKGDSRFFKHPTWSADGKGIYFVFTEKRKPWDVEYHVGYRDVTDVLKQMKR